MSTTLCLRCNIPMTSQGVLRLHEGTNWGIVGELGEIFVNQKSFHVLICPNCGKAEFFVPRIRAEMANRDTFAYQVEVAAPDQVRPAAVKDMLKLTAGVSMLEDCYDAMSRPASYRLTDNGAVLCYPSGKAGLPHVIVLDEDRFVRLAAVYNRQEAFSLEDLERAYGERELAGVIGGNEHWVFPEQAVAFIVEGRVDSEILYVQFLSPSIDFEHYLAAAGFSAEVLGCH